MRSYIRQTEILQLNLLIASGQQSAPSVSPAQPIYFSPQDALFHRCRGSTRSGGTPAVVGALSLSASDAQRRQDGCFRIRPRARLWLHAPQQRLDQQPRLSLQRGLVETPHAAQDGPGHGWQGHCRLQPAPGLWHLPPGSRHCMPTLLVLTSRPGHDELQADNAIIFS